MSKNLSIPIDLSIHLNNKGISWPTKRLWGQMDHSGISLPGELLPSGTTISLYDTSFFFPMTDTHSNDHIYCEGQTISVSKETFCSSIVFLGFSLYGDYSEEILLHYVDSTIDKATLGLSDWYCLSIPGNRLVFGEHAAFLLPYYYQQSTPLRSQRGIWIQRVPLNTNKALKAIELPDNPYMLIFSITQIIC